MHGRWPVAGTREAPAPAPAPQPHAARPLDQSAALGAGELGLIINQLALRLGADVLLLAVGDPSEELVDVVAMWGLDGRPPPPSPANGGFVGRALTSQRAADEPLDVAGDDSLGQAGSGVRLTYAMSAPVRRPAGSHAALCAGFAAPPADRSTSLWLLECHAALAALCLHDAGTFSGLLAAARRDDLTGCLTHAELYRELLRDIRRSSRSGRPVSCCFIDLDRFKQVNTDLGHLAGSRVLSEVAAVLQKEMRAGDTLGRYGGDEFVAVLPDTDETAARRFAERLLARIGGVAVNGSRVTVGASIGVAQWRPGHSADWTLALADKALGAAKAVGGGVVVTISDVH